MIIGYATSVPDGSSPQDYVRLLAVDHRIKTSSLSSEDHPRRYSTRVLCHVVENATLEGKVMSMAQPPSVESVQTSRRGRCRRVVRAPSPHVSAEKGENVQLH